MGGIKFKVEDKAIKMNVEGKEKNMEGKEKNMTQVPGRWGKKYVEGKEKNVEGEEVKLPDYEPWEVREAKVEEEDKELRNIMYLRKRRLEKEADPEKSIKQAIQVTKPKKKMKKSKLDLRCQEGVTMQVLKLLGSSYKFKAKMTNKKAKKSEKPAADVEKVERNEDEVKKARTLVLGTFESKWCEWSE